jgi:hypothetical protein
MHFFLSSLFCSLLLAACIFGTLVGKRFVKEELDENGFIEEKQDDDSSTTERIIDGCLDRLEMKVWSTSDLHTELKKECISRNVPELFVRNLIVNWQERGPHYTRKVDVIEDYCITEGEDRGYCGKFFVVEKLDFGKIDSYLGVKKEDQLKVLEMKTNLIKSYMFRTPHCIKIKNVRVNEIDYGCFQLRNNNKDY